MSATLLVLAGGFGRRFGGFKQIEPITNSGRVIVDFSVYDAVQAGFENIVFVISKEFRNEFIQTVGARAEKVAKSVKYVTQSWDDCPVGRAKPLGTSHAIWCCKDVVSDPFAIVNADDYYGKQAFELAYNHLIAAKPTEYGMVAYKLGNTLSESGSVCRGVCKFQGDLLTDIEESKIDVIDGKIVRDDGVVFDPATPVSMNLWLFTPDVFAYLDKQYKDFLVDADLMKDEFLIPISVDKMIKSHQATVKGYLCHEKWIGITYRQDLGSAKVKLNQLVDEGLYKGF